ncbi:hypothetical protein OBBRIDRAFT_573898 [Obba rivulosa]|uniref:Uncharacterized protein n=1 Tax=Obba rivulosa TaxID=1052685 RepID=A0A8E2J621_9APHY|nr:hypothetical protein OBBRIDRAFT_573898 [Obba rivulosa]
MSSSRISLSLAGQGIPQAPSTLTPAQSPATPSSPHRPTKAELESKLAHAKVRAEQRKYPAGLGLGLPSNVSSRTYRAISGVGLGISVVQPVTGTASPDASSLLPTRVSRASRAPNLPTIPSSPDERIPFSPRPAHIPHGLGLGLTPNTDSDRIHGLGLGLTPIIPQESFSQPIDTFRRTPGAPIYQNSYFPAIVPSPLRNCTREYFSDSHIPPPTSITVERPSLLQGPLLIPLRHPWVYDLLDEPVVFRPQDGLAPNTPRLGVPCLPAGQASFFLPTNLLTPADDPVEHESL